ncbi:sodium/hydrogen exchanger 6 [Tanacetum coccineum]
MQRNRDVVDTGAMKMSNISSPNPFVVLGVDEDEDEENIRGLNRAPKQKEVCQVVNENNLSICAILESHVDVAVVYDTCKKNDDIMDVIIMAQTNQVMHVQINIRADNKVLFCSFIYADNYYVDRRALWNNLDAHASLMRDKPWVLLGYFNAALNLEDHSCGGYEPNIAMREFKEFQPYRISDHSPCVLRILKVSRPKHKPFKFSNFLVYKEGFCDVAESGWSLNVTGCAMYRVVKRLKGLKTPFRKLLHDQGNLHDRVNRLRVELDEAQKAIDLNPSCSLLRDEHAHYLMAFKESSLDEESFLRQKSKIEWLNAGDSNTAYFHKIVKSKCARNRIEMVRDSSNVLHEGNTVASAFVSHYEQFLGIEGTTTPLDDHGALFSMGDDKAPGPDVFTAAFFKKSWDIVGGEITIAIRDFFTNGKLLKELNHTIISLISKVSTPSKINDYRPISCCNVLFKYISKIIANRIKWYLRDLVRINQSAFIPGRQISDNILLTQELMRNYHQKRGPPICAFKVDIQKAYDTVEWGFLRSILVGFGFHPTMVNWIMVCVTTTSYSININGWFNEDFQYHHLCEQQRIVNLYFADDVFLFTRGHPNSVRVIMDALEEFKNLLGLVSSIPKSNALFCNVPNALKANILSYMPFAEGTLPVIYLGVPLISSRLLYRDCKGKSFWDVPCLGDVSWGWRKLLQIRPHVRPFIWHNINNGRSTAMWFDKWVDPCSLRDMLTVRNIVRSDFSLSDTVSNLISNGSWRWPHDWSSIFLNVVNILVPEINNDLDDEIVWRDVRGVFQRFSVVGAWDSLRLRVDVVDWYHVIWFLHYIPRHAIHMWLVIKEKLKTQDRLRQWDVGPSIDLNLLKCPLCDMVPDSHSHLFFECLFASQVWFQVRALTGMSSVPLRFVDVLAFLISSKGS